ncbi:MAG TPA: hypothetical protein VNL14_20450 [Candidatus Acidoferrales bacterium]|nr:hypothetical protein [Candidatus Acidoferrales bacterium]
MSPEPVNAQVEPELEADERELNESLRERLNRPNNGARARAGRAKKKYKTVPDDWKAIPPGRFTAAIGHIEAVLLEITVDPCVTANVFDWKPTLPTLRAWCDHLRAALKALTAGQAQAIDARR